MALRGSSLPARRPLLEQLLSALRVVERRRLPRRQVDRVFQTLTELLQRDPDEEVRHSAAYALTFWGERRAPHALRAVLGNREETPRVRGQAAEGIANGLERRRLTPSERERLLSTLGGGLREEAAEIRFWCLYAVGQLHLTEVRSEVEQLRASDTRLYPGWWHVSEEAADVLTFWDTGDWPEHTAASSL